MSTPTFDSLRTTLKNLRRRRNNLFILKQSSYFVIALAVVILSVSALTAVLDLDKAATTAMFAASVVLLGLMVWQLMRVLSRRHSDDRQLAHYVEDHIPDLEQRLLTSLEFSEEDLIGGRRGVSKQFIQRLWLDAQEHVQQQQEQVRTVAPARASWWSFAAALSVAAVVTFLFGNSEFLLNAGSRLAWPFAITEPVTLVEILPDIEITVEPGDLELQRGDSVTIVARVINAVPESIKLRTQTDNVNWRDLSMSRDGSGSDSATYSYYIPSLQEDTTYYVTFNERGEQNSTQYRISLFDLPQIQQIDLAYDYPEYTGFEDILEEDSGDMVVPEGTEVELIVTFNKPIAVANVEFDESYSAEADEIELPAPYVPLQMEIEGNIGRASFTVTQNGVYRILATDLAAMESKNPLDYFIRAIVDTPPELTLKRPGRDRDVMPLEEVVLEIDASDDYGLSSFTLNYSVVGADEVEVNFLPQANMQEVTGNELIYMEDLEVEPGDFVTYYLTLADNNDLRGPNEVISDIYFLQVIPTDQEFRRAAGMSGGQGAGGGQGGDSSALVSVQKDIIAATWKLKNRQSKVSVAEFVADAEIISESQREATGRARQSIDRLAERLSFSDDTYDSAVENLSLAIEQMNLAAQELDKEQITSALKPEQLALQFILKAEASINRTDISMQQGGGGGGGGARQEREDLRELFEMELGQLENRYETTASRGGQSQQETEEANKLEELARRQEGLTRAQRNLARREEQMTEEQKRRELERLMRQQEQLSQEVAQLAQQMSRGQQRARSQSQSQSQSQSHSSSSSAASGGQQSSQQAQQTPLQRAAQQMQEAARSETAAMAAARSQKALDNLREQQRELNQRSDNSVNQLAQNLGQRGRQLLQEQRELQDALQRATREQGLGQTRRAVRDGESMQALVEAQQQQQRSLGEIEDMLRAIIARGDNDDQRLMSQAQAASRELRPIREEMQTSNRVLRNGMVNLAVDIERELEAQIEEFAQSLAALNPAQSGSRSSQLQQVAAAAELLREQIEELQQQALAFKEAGAQAGAGTSSIREMREQLERTQQLAEQLTQQLQQQAQAPGQPGQQGQPGQAGGGGRQQIGGARGNTSDRVGRGGSIDTSGNNSPIGNARSILQQLTQKDIEDFLSQPELFRQLLQPILELEGALRAQAELDTINNKLYATVDEDIPDEYRGLVEIYYRVLSEIPGSANSAQ
jgi:hypothetical protein